MARIQGAHNSFDFAPGTAKFQQAHDFILELSTRDPLSSAHTRRGQLAHERPYTSSWVPTLSRTATSPSHSNTTRAS